MLRDWSDVLTSADVWEVTLLGLLDLSAALDCVNHDILLHGLEVAFGLTNTALEWIRSHTAGLVLPSPMQCVLFGVLQGSVFGPPSRTPLATSVLS